MDDAPYACPQIMDQPTPPPHRIPPRYVPTLTEVVQLPAAPAPQAPALPTPVPVHVPVSAQVLQEAITHRVMQRVDSALEPLLRQAVAELVMTHMQLLEPMLREEIEAIVRKTVSESLAQELDGRKV